MYAYNIIVPPVLKTLITIVGDNFLFFIPFFFWYFSKKILRLDISCESSAQFKAVNSMGRVCACVWGAWCVRRGRGREGTEVG